MTNLILASSSPYRKSLLNRLGLPFECHSPDIDETPHSGESTKALAERLACQKARKVAEAFPHAVVIGSDQVAEVNKQICGKPDNHENAVIQLRQQSGQQVFFQTGLAVMCLDKKFVRSTVNTTEVTFRKLDEDEIERYLLKEQVYDCAGAFKAEELGISLFSALHSNDPTSLIGLPLIELSEILRELNYKIP